MKIVIPVRIITRIFFVFLLFLVFFLLGFFANQYYGEQFSSGELLNPFVDSGQTIRKPLQQYTIPNLQKQTYSGLPITLEKVLQTEAEYTAYVFSYTTLGKKMTGQINIPVHITANPEQQKKVIFMLRGYVPQESYTTGVGTKNVAAAFAKAGYITIAPDFFGYGDSDPEPTDTWQTRFEKPITVIELITSVRTHGIPLKPDEKALPSPELNKVFPASIGIWAHSNGGQIALTTLEIMQEAIPTALWAPVTAPFPYSILYFSDELADEGKEQRKWISLFEETYDVHDFSLTRHLHSLVAPIQIQHGEADDAALVFWSKEFTEKINQENQRRASEKAKTQKELSRSSDKNIATETSKINEISQNQEENIEKTSIHNNFEPEKKSLLLEPIQSELITYPNTDHNMQPNWNTAVQKDLQFFGKWL